MGKLGEILNESKGQDSINLEIQSVIAKCILGRGEFVFIENGIAYPVGATYPYSKGAKANGVIDPFLNRCVKPGEKCWVLLQPNPIDEQVAISRKWIENFAANLWIENFPVDLAYSYELLMNIADMMVNGEQFRCCRNNICEKFQLLKLYESIYNSLQFWEHYSIVKNKKITGVHLRVVWCKCCQ